ncbi:hypothetical protein [Paraburkholderia tropica]|uniref:hypothetical protein n=1 Tax=Paraburkholderia tropica TaxID=92647 RepID=UPI0007ED5E7A|nr:hypothetical protein [Paraburkholderia tropica]OBR48415.1 hypothetical protein A6456_36945 [Paraburkholderia tropica]
MSMLSRDAATRPPAELHRLISQAIRDRALAAQLRDTPDAAYEAFGVPAAQRALLAADAKGALSALGVHANLQIKFLALRGMLSLTQISVQPVLADIAARAARHRTTVKELQHGAYR